MFDSADDYFLTESQVPELKASGYGSDSSAEKLSGVRKGKRKIRFEQVKHQTIEADWL